MNKNFRNYPRKADIDAHGVDLLTVKNVVIDNYGTYTAARYVTYSIDKGNTEKLNNHSVSRRERDAIIARNDLAERTYRDVMQMYDNIAAHNEAHPDNPIPQIHMPKPPVLEKVPDLKKTVRMDSIPMRRWYVVGKAPIPADTEVEAK